MKKLAYLLPVLMLCACASGPAYNYSSLPPIQKGQAQFVVYRPNSFLMISRSPTIDINAIESCDSVSGGYFVVNRPTGTTVISTSLWDMPGTSRMRLNAEAKRYYIKVEPNGGKMGGAIIGGLVGSLAAEGISHTGPFELTNVSPESAQQEMQGIKQTKCK